MHIACACFSDFQSGYLVMEGFRKFLRFLRSFCWICNILCNIYMHSLFILPKITLSRVSINKKNVTDLNLVQFGEQGMRLCSFPKKKKKKKRKKGLNEYPRTSIKIIGSKNNEASDFLCQSAKLRIAG